MEHAKPTSGCSASLPTIHSWVSSATPTRGTRMQRTAPMNMGSIYRWGEEPRLAGDAQRPFFVAWEIYGCGYPRGWLREAASGWGRVEYSAMSDTPPAATSWRGRLHEIIFEADTSAGKAFDVALMVAIILSVFAVCLESVTSIELNYGPALRVAEWAFTILFTIEYVLRLSCVTSSKPIRRRGRRSTSR